MLFIVGAAAAVAPAPEVHTQAAPPVQPVAPPAPATVTVTVPGPKQPFIPDACKDYLAKVDVTVQSVYDYEHGIAPTEQALSDALQAMIERDPVALNDVRTRINHIQNNTGGDLQTIVLSRTDIANAADACHKALGG